MKRVWGGVAIYSILKLTNWEDSVLELENLLQVGDGTHLLS